MPEPLLNVIQYLSSSLALVAFISAVIFYGYREKLRTQQKNIQHARPADVDDVIATANEYVKVELEQIPKNQRKDIVLRQLEIKQIQQSRQGRNTLIIAVLLACLAAFAIATFRPEQTTASTQTASKPAEEPVDQIPKAILIPPAMTGPPTHDKSITASKEGTATQAPPVTEFIVCNVDVDNRSLCPPHEFYVHIGHSATDQDIAELAVKNCANKGLMAADPSGYMKGDPGGGEWGVNEIAIRCVPK